MSIGESLTEGNSSIRGNDNTSTVHPVDGGRRSGMQWSSFNSFIFKYTLSTIAATVAETVTYPLDLTKTRLQIQGQDVRKIAGEICSVQHRGMIKTAVGIVHEEGLFRLWQGVTPAIYRHFVYTGCRMAAYEQMRDLLGRDPDGMFPIWKAIVGGLTAGAFGQFLASPTDLVKVQMQMEGRRRLEGKPPRVKSTLHAFQKILSEGGIRGLWKGWVPNVQRAALVNMGDLATYDTVKRNILKHSNLQDNYVTHTLSSAASGLVAATMGTPADVIKTRIMNQPTDDKGRLPLDHDKRRGLSSSVQRICANLGEDGAVVTHVLALLRTNQEVDGNSVVLIGERSFAFTVTSGCDVGCSDSERLL